jgi:uncharacterized protein YjiS (DUF1127 family)
MGRIRKRMEMNMNPVDCGWSHDFQHRVMTEARREQAMTMAQTFGGAYAAVAKFLKSAVASVAQAMKQAHQMAELSHLSDRQLADIGIKRSDIPQVVMGEPVGHYAVDASGLKAWKPAPASNDWQSNIAAA